jgi:endo-1,4-beta-xylanase
MFPYRFSFFNQAVLAVSALVFLKSATAIPVPDGMPLRQIVAERYAGEAVYIGGTTGWDKYDRKSGLLIREFGYATPENDFKQHAIHPQPGRWNWEVSDAWVEYASANNLLVRIHGPIGPQVSKWAKADNRTSEELARNMEAFFTALCQRYDEHPQVKWMDVVNETVTRKGEWFMPKPGNDKWENPWPKLGFDEAHPLRPPIYIKRAFEIANKHAPNTRLIFNQHGSMEPEMWERVLATIDYLLEQGLRVDGLGWQAHVDVGWEKVPGNVEMLNELIDWAHARGLSFHVTENNVWLRGEPKDYEAQAETFAAILRILLGKRSGGEIGWNVWNLSDADAWSARSHLDGSIFDHEWAPKPAYYALQRVLLEMADGASE